MLHGHAGWSALIRKLARWAGWTLALVGATTIVLSGWLMTGRSTGLKHLVIESDDPQPAAVIVCMAGGMTGHGLPSAEGWDRIYTAVQLQADGLAPVIVFSGGGAQRLSEAEVYASAARWLGTPPDGIVLDPIPGSTAEHAGNLLQLDAITIRRDTPLLVVTSTLHSRRAAMSFRKAGFTRVRMVSSYEARQSAVARSTLRSEIPSFVPNQKDYGDPLNRLRWGLNDTMVALRELLAITVYRYRGQA